MQRNADHQPETVSTVTPMTEIGKMKYIVTKYEVWAQSYEIEADNGHQALEYVREGGGELIETLFEYSHTLDAETWKVEPVQSTY